MYFVKLEEALKFKEAIQITLNVINLVALQCVKFKIKIKNKTFFNCPSWNGAHSDTRMTHLPHKLVKRMLID